MAYINSNHNKRKEIPDIPYEGVGELQLNRSLEEVISWVEHSTESLEMKKLAEEVVHRVKCFSEKFFRKKEKLSAIHLDSFVTACKHRSDELTLLMNSLSLVGNEVEIFVKHGQQGSFVESLNYVSGKDTLFLLDDEEDEAISVYTMTQKPKFYSTLYVGVIKVMQEAIKLQNIDRQDYKFCLYLAEIIISLSKVHLEFRSNEELIKVKEQKMFNNLQDNFILDKTSDCYKVLEIVMADIKAGVKPYIKQMHDAIETCKEATLSPFGDKDYYYSAKATASEIKGKTREISLLASVYEVDPFIGDPIDQVIGYVSHYNKTAPTGYFDPVIKTITINQHKMDRRGIHIGDNPVQDRCNYIHRRMSNVLSCLRSDCTKRQDGGVTFAKIITSPTFRMKNGWPGVICKDFSNATDTLSQEFQSLCLGLIFEPEIVDFWDKVAKSPKLFKFFGSTPNKTYVQTSGQPQGLLGSFDCFAFAHHIIMLMTMYMSGLTKYQADRFYRVLGDDSIICTIISDPHDVVESNYEQAVSFVNWHINHSKSRVVRYEDRTAFAEFAKVTVLNGEIMSPPPFRILSRVEAGTTNYYSYTTAIWMLKHGYTMPNVLDNLNDKWYGADPVSIRTVNQLIFGGIIPQFNEFSRADGNDIIELGKITLCYLITKIRGTFIEFFLNDKEREDMRLNSYKISDAFTSIMSRNPEYYMDQIEDPDHKLIKAIQKNVYIEDALKSILGLSDATLILPLFEVTEYEMGAIFTIADIIELTTVGLFDEAAATKLIGLNKSLESLDRFQMRSIHKHIAREISYFDEVIHLYKTLFNSEESNETVNNEYVDSPIVISEVLI